MRLKATCSFLAALAIVCAQSPSRVATGLETIKASELKTELTHISSDQFEGRLSLAPGSDLVIKWIAAEFKKAGLKPIAGDSYLQPVPLIDYRADRQANSLTLHLNGKEEVFHAPDATSNFPNPRDVKGQVVFAGFGITAPELRYDDYAGLDAQGKIVLVFNHEPQEDDARSIFNGKGNTRYANTRAKMTNAARHGAVALLIMPDPNHPPGMTRGRAAGQGGAGRGADKQGKGKQGAAPLRPQQALADDVSIPVFNVDDKLGEELLSVTERKPGEIQTDIDSTLKPQPLKLRGIEVALHTATTARRVANSYNVAGVIEGSDPALAAETIVFSGHYDHDGPAPNGGIYHGADDNGSGTVGVVALARAFAKNPIKPKRALLFIVFAAEERGLLGSYYYCMHPLRPLATTRAVINFDMIGRNEAPSNQTNGLMEIGEDTSNELNLIGAKYSPDYKAIAERNNNLVGLALNYKWDEDTVLNVLFRSDQYPFLMHDIPAFWWFTGFHPDYHQVTDTAEKINYVKMEKILKLAFLTGFDFADGETPPKFRAVGGK